MNNQSDRHSVFGRRNLLKIGLGTAVGTAITSSVQSSLSPIMAQGVAMPLLHEFYLEPGIFADFEQVDQVRTLSQLSPWAIPNDYASSIALLSNPTSEITLPDLVTWIARNIPDCSCEVKTAHVDAVHETFDAIMKVPIAGGFNMTEISGQSVLSLLGTRALDLTLEFQYPKHYELSKTTFLPLIQQGSSEHSLTASSTVISAGAPPSVELYGWKFQFRTDKPHSFGSCVRQPVNHFHIEAFRSLGGGRYQYVLNFHIGAYIDGGRRCFVLWENVSTGVCWKVCGPTWNDLYAMMKWMVAAAAIVAGVALAGWIVAAIASALATALWVPLLLL